MGTEEVLLHAATCEEEGSYGIKCANCDYEEVYRTEDKLKHEMQLVRTKDATPGIDGEEVYKCSRPGCGHEETKPIHYLSGNWEFGLQDETGKWERVSYDCKAGEAPSPNLHIVQFCTACEKHEEGLQVAAMMDRMEWMEYFPEITVTHVGSTQPVHLYTKGVDENGNTVEGYAECDFCYSCKQYLNVGAQELHRHGQEEDTCFCMGCKAEVAVIYDEGRDLIDWCNVGAHVLVLDEEQSEEATPEKDGTEVWKCTECEYQTDPKVVHYAEENWCIEELVQNEYVEAWYECSMETLPEKYRVVKYCMPCRLNGELVVTEEKSFAECEFTEEKVLETTGELQTIKHVCPDGPTHYYRAIGEGDKAKTYCLATRYCVCCSETILTPHHIHLTGNGKATCETCGIVDVTEEIGGDIILNEQWCEIFKENHPWLVDEENTYPPTEDMCGQNVWYCGFNGGHTKVEAVHKENVNWDEQNWALMEINSDGFWVDAEFDFACEGFDASQLEGREVYVAKPCPVCHKPKDLTYRAEECLALGDEYENQNGELVSAMHICAPGMIHITETFDTDGGIIVKKAHARICLRCRKLICPTICTLEQNAETGEWNCVECGSNVKVVDNVQEKLISNWCTEVLAGDHHQGEEGHVYPTTTNIVERGCINNYWLYSCYICGTPKGVTITEDNIPEGREDYLTLEPHQPDVDTCRVHFSIEADGAITEYDEEVTVGEVVENLTEAAMATATLRGTCGYYDQYLLRECGAMVEYTPEETSAFFEYDETSGYYRFIGF